LAKDGDGSPNGVRRTSIDERSESIGISTARVNAVSEEERSETPEPSEAGLSGGS
jgi:hypothetical protein